MPDFYPCSPYRDTDAPATFSEWVKNADTYSDAPGAITVTEAGGELILTSNTNDEAGREGGIMSDLYYDFTGKSMQAELVTHAVGVGQRALIMIEKDVHNRIKFNIVDNNERISAQMRNSTDPYTEVTWAGWPTSYNAAVHKFIRLREASGDIFFEYSTLGSSWVEIHSMPNPFVMTSIRLFYGKQMTGSATPGGHITTWRNYTSNV